MNPVAIFDSEIVTQVQTRERWVLEHQIKNLLLELASIDTIVFQRKRDQALIVNDSME